jgi:excisionase family DNA binding protein
MKPPAPLPARLQLLTLQQVSETTALSVTTLRRAIRLRRLPAHRVGRRALRISEADLQAWLAGCRSARR